MSSLIFNRLPFDILDKFALIAVDRVNFGNESQKAILIVSISFMAIVVSGFVFVMITGACGFSPAQGHDFHKRGMPRFMQKEIGHLSHVLKNHGHGQTCEHRIPGFQPLAFL